MRVSEQGTGLPRPTTETINQTPPGEGQRGLLGWETLQEAWPRLRAVTILILSAG